ncbi:MAG: response regulator [Gammaproteobacteria bacterium]|nr:response regulator [Gammaproteobacteria bacterium]
MVQKVFIIDDDVAVRDAMGMLLDSEDLPHVGFESADSFLGFYDGNQSGCLVLDIRMPGMTGLELQKVMSKFQSLLPIIFITGHGDIPMAVEAMRHGAFDFLRKPIQEPVLIQRIKQALNVETNLQSRKLTREKLHDRIDSLTHREFQVFEEVAQGHANKAIAVTLDISERTVEVHRAQVMKKLATRSIAEVVRIHIEFELFKQFRNPPRNLLQKP